jgi:ribonucleoside-triphosphate reductase
MTDDLIVGNITIPAEQRQPCEVYSRVVGYLRPVAQWNKGKQSEWTDRIPFRVNTPKEVK